MDSECTEDYINYTLHYRRVNNSFTALYSSTLEQSIGKPKRRWWFLVHALLIRYCTQCMDSTRIFLKILEHKCPSSPLSQQCAGCREGLLYKKRFLMGLDSKQEGFIRTETRIFECKLWIYFRFQMHLGIQCLYHIINLQVSRRQSPFPDLPVPCTPIISACASQSCEITFY